MSVKTPEKISTRQALKAAVTDRQVLAMLILGLASGSALCRRWRNVKRLAHNG